MDVIGGSFTLITSGSSRVKLTKSPRWFIASLYLWAWLWETILFKLSCQMKLRILSSSTFSYSLLWNDFHTFQLGSSSASNSCLPAGQANEIPREIANRTKHFMMNLQQGKKRSKFNSFIAMIKSPTLLSGACYPYELVARFNIYVWESSFSGRHD